MGGVKLTVRISYNISYIQHSFSYIQLLKSLLLIMREDVVYSLLRRLGNPP